MTGITRLAVVSRGAAATRLVHAAREHAAERGRAVRVIAVHRQADAGSMFVREADEAVLLDDDGPTEVDAIERALVRCAADAVWAGWGPLAQSAEFAERCAHLGVLVVGLAASSLRIAADRDLLARVATGAGVALSPLSIVDRGYAQHVDVLVAGDRAGTVWVLGVHDGTLQRRSEKVLVETARLEPAEHDHLVDAATHVAADIGVVGAATLAFAREDLDAPLSLLRVSGGLPLGHGVTEATAGIDLAKLQLAIAEGDLLDGAAPSHRGHAVAVRLDAEDAELGFAPAPGRIVLLRVPTGPGLRIDPAVVEGDAVRSGDDPTLAEVVAWGRSRDEAFVRLGRALVDLPVVLDGGTTNKGFLLDLLRQPDLVGTGRTDTAWIDRRSSSGDIGGREHGDVAVLVAAIDAYDRAHDVDREHLFATARQGRPHVSGTIGRRVELCHRGHEYVALVRRTGRRRYRVAIDGAETTVVVTRLDEHQRRVEIGARTFRVVSAVQGGDHLVEVDGVPHRLARGDGGIVRAGMPGVVVAVHVAVGDLVDAGDMVATIESMKMESPVLAPFDGRVRQVCTGTNVQVAPDAPLVQLEPRSRSIGAASEPRLAFTDDRGLEPDPGARVATTLDTLTRLVLGYDIPDAVASRVVADRRELAATLAGLPARAELVAGELRLLGVFADLRALFRSHRDTEDTDLQVRSSQEHLHAFLRAPGPDVEGLSARFLDHLRRALGHYGVRSLDPSEALDEALFWIMQSRQRAAVQVPVVVAILTRWIDQGATEAIDERWRDTLDRLVEATQRDQPVVADLAREVRYQLVDRPVVDAARAAVLEAALERLEQLLDGTGDREAHCDALLACPEPLEGVLLDRARRGGRATAAVIVELLVRRYHRWGRFGPFEVTGTPATVTVDHDTVDREHVRVIATCAPMSSLAEAIAAVAERSRALADGSVPIHVEVFTWIDTLDSHDDTVAEQAAAAISAVRFGDGVQHVVVALDHPDHVRTAASGSVHHLTFRFADDGVVEDRFLHGLHPMMAERLQLWRLSNFSLEHLPATPGIHLFRCVAPHNTSDERLFAIAEVRDLTAVRDGTGRLVGLPELERTLIDALEAIRRVQAPRPLGQRLWWNRVVLQLWPALTLDLDEVAAIATRLAPATVGLGLEEVHVLCHRPDPATGELRDRALRFTNTTDTGFVLHETVPPSAPLEPLDEYARKVVQSRRRGTIYPYELIRTLVAPQAGGRSEITGGSFVEHDLDDDANLVPVDRPAGRNTASIVAGVVTNTSVLHPEGMARVVLLGDPTRALGALAEPECRRIIAALDLAERMQVPLEWFALSAGAKIAMDSGTENMDWISAVLRRIIEHTQRGGEINVVVTGINVGAQPYWNAEATMLMHTSGILVMTPDSAMVLTGKQALDFSGGVSAEDNHGIGGYERVMGPNGQAQYWAADLPAACGVLLAHYAHTYVMPGERFPRRGHTTDPIDRDVRSSPHHLRGSELTTVGDVFSDRANPDRKQPFAMRSVMRAVVDADDEVLERWADLADADTAVVWDARVGGIPVCAIGIEAHAVPRRGHVPADGPDQWTSGTLFPMSSKKVARAINATSGHQPLLVLANLSGFDGSPESMRRTQLEFGAEIGRAVVNFRGPIVFCVVSRFHGGAFVVFSRRLNEQLESLAVEGAHASVIGGSPAAAVVFSGEVDKRTRSDARLVAAEAAVAGASGAERARLRSELEAVRAEVHSDQLGAVAAEFDAVHSVERAQQVGSVNRIIPAAQLRPLLVDALERGIAVELARVGLPS